MSARETVLVSEVIPTSRERIYSAWLDSRQHSAFTGETADIDPSVGGHISTFGGYASGKNLELEPSRRIVQTWRSTEFPDGSPDSRLEVTLEDTAGGTLVTVLHTEIPEGHGDRYRDGWVRYYLEPMKRYFAKHTSNGVNHQDASLVEDVSADAGESGEEAGEDDGQDDGLTAAVAQIAEREDAGEGAEASADDDEGGAVDDGDGDGEEIGAEDEDGEITISARARGSEDEDEDEAMDGVRTGGSGEGLEVIEETSLPMTPPVPGGRASSARPRPRQASSQARNGKPDRKKRVAAALAKVSGKGAGAKPGASKSAKAAPSKTAKNAARSAGKVSAAKGRPGSSKAKPAGKSAKSARSASAGKGAGARGASAKARAGKTAKGKPGRSAAAKAKGGAAKTKAKTPPRGSAGKRKTAGRSGKR